MQINKFTGSFSVLFLLLTVSIQNSYALGKAASMGNLQAIVPGSPFDTTRNPALLAYQNTSNSTGFFYSYITHFSGKNSTENYGYQKSDMPFDSAINSDIKQEDPKIYGMSARISNVTKSGNFAIGFAFADNGNDQYLVTESNAINETIGTDISSGTMVYNKVNESVKTTEINPAFVTSLCFNISEINSIGLQLIIGYSDKKEEKKLYVQEYYGTLVAVPPAGAGVSSFREKQNKNVNRISAELGFGYLYKKDDEQAGILIRTGEVSFIKKEMETRRENISPAPGNLSADSSIKINGQYSSGPGITAGAYKRFNDFIAFAIESGIKFENSYRDKDFKIIKNTAPPEYRIIEEDTIVKADNTYSFSAGFEINPFKNFVFALGSEFLTGTFYSNQYKETEDFEKRFNAKMDIQYLISTAGIQYSFNKNITIDLISATILYRKKIYVDLGEKDNINNNKSSFSSRQKIEGAFLHTGLGITLSL